MLIVFVPGLQLSFFHHIQNLVCYPIFLFMFRFVNFNDPLSHCTPYCFYCFNVAQNISCCVFNSSLVAFFLSLKICQSFLWCVRCAFLEFHTYCCNNWIQTIVSVNSTFFYQFSRFDGELLYLRYQRYTSKYVSIAVTIQKKCLKQPNILLDNRVYRHVSQLYLCHIFQQYFNSFFQFSRSHNYSQIRIFHCFHGSLQFSIKLPNICIKVVSGRCVYLDDIILKVCDLSFSTMIQSGTATNVFTVQRNYRFTIIAISEQFIMHDSLI